MTYSFRRALGVGAKVLDHPGEALRVVSEEPNGGIAGRAKKASHSAGRVVVIDTEVPLSATGLRPATGGADSTLSGQECIVVFRFHAVVASEGRAAVVRLLPVWIRTSSRYLALTAPCLQVAASSAPAKLTSGLGDPTARAMLLVTGGRLPRAWISAQPLLVGTDTGLADRAAASRSLPVAVEVGERFPEPAVGAVATVKHRGWVHVPNLPLIADILPLSGIGRRWHAGHGA